MASTVTRTGGVKLDLEDIVNVKYIRVLIQEAFNAGNRHGYQKRIEYEQTVEFENEMRERFMKET